MTGEAVDDMEAWNGLVCTRSEWQAVAAVAADAAMARATASASKGCYWPLSMSAATCPKPVCD